MRLEVDPSASRIGLEYVLYLQETFDFVAPLGFPGEGFRLSVALQDLGLGVKNLSGIEIIARVRPEVGDRTGHQHPVTLAPQ